VRTLSQFSVSERGDTGKVLRRLLADEELAATAIGERG
jgi:hypothetical protein